VDFIPFSRNKGISDLFVHCENHFKGRIFYCHTVDDATLNFIHAYTILG
jgi:hypothetical protein